MRYTITNEDLERQFGIIDSENKRLEVLCKKNKESNKLMLKNEFILDLSNLDDSVVTNKE